MFFKCALGVLVIFLTTILRVYQFYHFKGIGMTHFFKKTGVTVLVYNIQARPHPPPYAHTLADKLLKFKPKFLFGVIRARKFALI